VMGLSFAEKIQLADAERDRMLEYEVSEELIASMVDFEEALVVAQREFWWEQLMVMQWAEATDAQKVAIRGYLKAGYYIEAQRSDGDIICYHRGDENGVSWHYRILENGDLEPWCKE